MKIKIEVGEPRGFDAGDKTNIIIGNFVEGLDGFREVDPEPDLPIIVQGPGREKKLAKLYQYWFVIACKPIVFEESRISSILFVPRYKTKKPPFELFGEGQELVVNGIWRQDGKDWDQQSIAEAQDGKIEIGGMIVASTKMVTE
ncbi:MAG: hypothetical protein HYS21_07215 [Deltaproteobacteria bacterium]|nr:hypothetical protein [Deltaproteobacteria bacterium]